MLTTTRLTLSDTGSGVLPPYQLYPSKTFLIGLASSALSYAHNIYFYTFWPNLDKFFAEGHVI